MGDYLLGILGIVVSVVLFLVGYRQTIGAKKERISAANAEVEKILVRRIVLESYTPKAQDINRVLDGKARDFRVKVGDLYSDSQVLTNIFTRIVESDFITQTQREDILKRLSPILAEAETTPVQEEQLRELPTSRQYVMSRLVPLTLAVAASLFGSLVAILPDIGKVEIGKGELLPVLLAVSAMSFVTIVFVYYLYRLRESQEETTVSSRSRLLQEYLEFERQVVETIQKAGGKVRPAQVADRGFDFEVDIDGKRILVEVKSLTRRLPASLTTRILQFLMEAVEREGANEGILVTNRPTELREPQIEGKALRIMSLRDLRNYLTHR